MNVFPRNRALLAAVLLMASCHKRSAAPIATSTSADAFVASALVDASTAANDAADSGALSPSDGVMDDAFRNTLASDLVAQVRARQWSAFVAPAGILKIEAPCVSLEDGTVIHGQSNRICSASKLEDSDVVGDLAQLADELSHRTGGPDEGWFCEGTVCRMNAGENGFNGDLRFAREGAFVRLIEVDSHCGGALSDETLKELARKNVTRTAPSCPKR